MGKRKELTQEERVVDYVRRFGSISSYEAFVDLGITRLSARIFNLKNDYYITWVWESRKNRLGETVHFKRYFIHFECGDGTSLGD